MTEVSNNLSYIFNQIKNNNPNHPDHQIYNELGKIITDAYVRKINEFNLPRKLNRFRKVKLNKQRQRQSKKGKNNIDARFEKEKKIDEFEKIRKSIIELSKFYSASDFDYNITLSPESSSSSDTNFVYQRKEISNKNDISEFKIDSEPKLKETIFDKKTKDNSTFMREKFELEDKNISTLKKNYKRLDLLRRAKHLDENVSDKIREPKDFYVISDSNGLILNSNEEVSEFLAELEKTKFDIEIAKFYSEFNNEIEDLTED